MNILRTPDERFENLPGYPFAPHYLEVDGLRIHYVDEGRHEGEIILMLHGEPSWSYLYRKMIPIFTEAGCRAIAPDLVGFGKSDKLADREDYTYQRYVDWMWGWMVALDLRDVTLICQDWGSLIGLRLVAEHPERFARVVLANGGLPTGREKMPRAFGVWQTFSQRVPRLPIGRIIQQGTQTKLPKEVIAAYEAPFPDESYKAAARVMPTLVPMSRDDPAADANRRAWKSLRTFDKPFLTTFSDSDPITLGGDKPFRKHVPGAQGQPHMTIEGAGHFRGYESYSPPSVTRLPTPCDATTAH
ncbi:MAG: haloalkane dehalogenase [Chloroflexota bacterium]|nr:haloalkane dehalogenase [Chloroflexota bacterium]